MWARMIDPDAVKRGQIRVLSATLVLRDSDVDSWVVKATADGANVSAFGEGWRMLFPGLTSGLATEFETSYDDGRLVLESTGVGELIPLNDRTTFPVPGAKAEAQTASAYYKAKGPAETVIRNLVNVNAGPGALVDRRADQFIVADDQERGSAVSVSTRFGSLLDEAKAAARTGGVTYSAIWEDGSRAAVLRFREPRDRSRWVRFGGRRGGLTGATIATSGPSVTDVIVAGQGEGTARTIRSYSQASAWGRRIEVFKDRRDTDDTTELDTAGAEALADGAASGSAKFTLTEVPGLVYGVDFELGDMVTVQVGDAQIVQPVRQVELTYDGHGRTATVTVGDTVDGDDTDEATVKEVRELEARVRRMETSQ